MKRSNHNADSVETVGAGASAPAVFDIETGLPGRPVLKRIIL